MCSLLRPFGAPVHWDEFRGTLYITSPALGRGVAFVTADPMGQELVARLKRAGAVAVLLDRAAETQGHETIVQLDIRDRGRPSVSAAYNWRCRDRSQPLAATLAASVAAAAGIPGRGTRLSLSHGDGISVRLAIALGRNPSADLVASVLDGVCAGLIHHWALTVPLELLPEPVPEAAAAAEESTPTEGTAEAPLPPTLPEPATGSPDDEPRITLYPDPSVVVTRPSQPATDLDLQARVTAIAGKVTPTAPAAPPAREPAKPTPTPTSAYPVLVTKLSNTRAALVIRGKRNVYFDPFHPPGDGPTVPFARESTPGPTPDDAPDLSPAVSLAAPFIADVPPEPEPEPEPEQVPVRSAPSFVAQAPVAEPAPTQPAPAITRASPPTKDSRRTVQVIQHGGGGTVIRLS